jgi:hypothetical protein
MKKLLSNINSQSDKTAFQTYTLKHGFESIDILIPLKNSNIFELSLKKIENDKTEILELLFSLGGEIKK